MHKGSPLFYLTLISVYEYKHFVASQIRKTFRNNMTLVERPPITRVRPTEGI